MAGGRWKEEISPRRALREWLDRVLPPHTIRADEEHFDRRYGLRYAEPHLLPRSRPAARGRVAMARAVAAALRRRRVVPPGRAGRHCGEQGELADVAVVGGRLSLGGLENAVTDLRDVPWLQASDVLYWGDLDVDGFAILSRLRTMLPHVRSLMMDRRTLEHWRERLAVRGTGGPAPLPPGLTVEEAEAFRICAAEDLRIEQERLPQPYVRAAITDP